MLVNPLRATLQKANTIPVPCDSGTLWLGSTRAQAVLSKATVACSTQVLLMI